MAAGFTPTDVQKAYNLTGLSSSGRTVAIVDAFGYPSLEADLATYRGQLRPARLHDRQRLLQADGPERWHRRNPPTDPGWDVEQALDVDSVSAACPDCQILVVQANSNSFADLGTAVNRAAMQSRCLGDLQQLRRLLRRARPVRLQPPGHRGRRVDR